MTPTSTQSISVRIASAIAICNLFVCPALAALPSLSGSVTVLFTFHSDDPNMPGDQSYWSYNGVNGSVTLALPSVTDTTIKPSLIGGGPVNWDNGANWVQPNLDTSALSIGQSGSGTYTATVNYGSSTLDVFRSGGPTSFNSSTYSQVAITNAIGSGEGPPSHDTTVPSNSFSNFKFNVTIPTGAQVHATGAFINLENFTIQSGGALLEPISTVKHDYTNHGSAALGGTVEGNFINDALVSAGNTATVTGSFILKGQLQNTGQIYVNPGILELDAATSNSGTLNINGGGLGVYAPFTNNGSMSLDNDGPFGYIHGSAAVTNSGTFQWTGGTITDIASFTNSGSLTLSGTANKYIGGVPFTNAGTISQSGRTPIFQFSAPFTNQAAGLYDITDNSGLDGSGTFSNAGLLRKSGGTGTSIVSEPITNSGTIAVNAGTLEVIDFTLTPSSTLQFQLRGTASSSDYGKIWEPYTLTLGGKLQITLGPGFSPALGNSFDLLDWGNGVSGTFTSLALPPLASGLKWNTAQLYTTGTIAVAAGIPGDFNQNGIVDAPDFILWRKYLGTIYTQSDYNTWRTHFGQTSGSGSGATAGLPSSAVPEPASITLLAISMGWGLRQRSRRIKPTNDHQLV